MADKPVIAGAAVDVEPLLVLQYDLSDEARTFPHACTWHNLNLRTMEAFERLLFMCKMHNGDEHLGSNE
jgi:hypothetical protein